MKVWFTLKEIADRESVSSVTVARWIKEGLTARDGTIIHLVAMKRGGKVKLTLDDLEDFFTRLRLPKAKEPE